VLRIGLTGGVASGKSTVAGMFAALGAEIIDTDQIAREVVAPGTPALAAIREHFGPEVIAADGSLNRRRMREIVFADADERHMLEGLLHPRIRECALERAAASRAPYVIIAVPLLFETGFDRIVDRAVVVDCPEALQLARLTARDGIDMDAARAMLNSQMSRSERLARADDVIDNSGSLEATQEQAQALHRDFIRRAQLLG
jgi:dephospho-CoA kinase